MSFDEVMDIKAYVKYYINDMNFFTIILKELTNVDTNDKKSGAHSLEHSFLAKREELICHSLP